MSLTSRITSPSGPNEELFGAAPKVPGCPAYNRVPSFLVLRSWGLPSPLKVQLRSHFALYGSENVNDRHDAADASKALANVVRHPVLGPATHVARATGHSDAGRQDRVGAVFGQVINGEIWPVAFGNPEELARQVHLQILMRVQRRGSVVQVRGRPWMTGVRDIDRKSVV